MFPHALRSVRQMWAKVTGKFKRDAVSNMKLLLCWVAVDEIRGAKHRFLSAHKGVPRAGMNPCQNILLNQCLHLSLLLNTAI